MGLGDSLHYFFFFKEFRIVFVFFKIFLKLIN